MKDIFPPLFVAGVNVFLPLLVGVKTLFFLFLAEDKLSILTIRPIAKNEFIKENKKQLKK